MEDLLVPFHYEYMRRAIFASAFIGGVCAALSCFVILKGWSLMGDALSHAIVPGVALAYLFGIPFSIGAFLSGILASVCIGSITARTKLKEDAVIGIVFTTFFAMGLLLISLYPSNISLKSIIFGNILGIADEDLIQMLIVSGITSIVLMIKWKDLLLYTFDPNQALGIGLNIKYLHYLLLSLLAATAVSALQTVGACLVVAMLVTPGATAYLLSDRFKTMAVIAILMGIFSSAFGAYLSYFLDGSTGGTIVTLQTVLFFTALIFAPKYGILTNRFRAKELAVAQVKRS